MASIDYVDPLLPGQQAIMKLYRNDQKLSGKTDQGIFDEYELDDIYTKIGNRAYERNVTVGNTMSGYTNWAHVMNGSGYGIWKYPIVDYIDDSVNSLYVNDIKLSYQGEAVSELTPLGFTKVYLGDSKRSGTTYTDITTEAGTTSGTPFNLGSTSTNTELITPTASGVDLVYFNIIEGSVTVNTVASASSYASYTEDTDYSIDYDNGTITLVSGGSISGIISISYSVGNCLYVGLSGASFNIINMSLAQRGVGNVYDYDYYKTTDGWTTCQPITDATNGYSNNGNIIFSGLTGWTNTTINSQDLYWIRQRLITPGIITPTGYSLLQGGSNVGTLLEVTGKEIKENSYKWCFFNDNIYVTIPNTGASNQEGILYLKELSSTANKQNFFIYNNIYKIDYKITSTNDLNIAGTVTAGGYIFPSSDPHVVGSWWDNGTTLIRSAG